MTDFSPEWRVEIGSNFYTSLTIADLNINSGRRDINLQPAASYCSLTVINFDQSTFTPTINTTVTVQIKDSDDNWVSLFGGFITDIDHELSAYGSSGLTNSYRIIALGAISKLTKTTFDVALDKANEGDQIYAILEKALFGRWNAVSPSLTWDNFDPAVQWVDALNNGISDVDRPGNYEMQARSASSVDSYDLISELAFSALGYIYEDSNGLIGYADSTRRATTLDTEGYTELDAKRAYAIGLKVSTKLGDIRNKVTIQYKNNQSHTEFDYDSIALYGEQAEIRSTRLELGTDAESQAQFLMNLRSRPAQNFESIRFPLTNPDITDEMRDALLNIYMGQPIRINNLPSNMLNGVFEGFVEGWTFQSRFNALDLTIFASPTEYSQRAYRWNDVSASEAWNTLSATMKWEEALGTVA